MAAENIVDLDVLRPEPRFIKLGGKEIDVSFVPCAITFDLEQIVQEMAKLTAADLTEGSGPAAKRGFDLAVQLCALFCQRKQPEMTAEWFMDNTDAGQVGVFAEAIKVAIVRSYEGVNRYQRNPSRAKPKTKETAK